MAQTSPTARLGRTTAPSRHLSGESAETLRDSCGIWDDRRDPRAMRHTCSGCLRRMPALPKDSRAERSPHDQSDRSQQAGRQRLEILHVLRRGSLAITQVQQPVIGEGLAGHAVDRQISHDDLEVVLACTQEAFKPQSVGRMPHRSCPLIVNINHCCLAYRALEPGPDTGCPRGPFRNRLALAKIEDYFTPCSEQARGHGYRLLIGSLARIEMRFAVVGPGMQVIHGNWPARLAERHRPSCAQIEWLWRRGLARSLTGSSG